MVKSWDARMDVDDELLTKSIVYRRFSNEVNDLAYETYDKTDYKDYDINIQCTIQSQNDKYVQEGILKEGDLVVFMRYVYEVDNRGKPIKPSLTPKKEDMICFNNTWFILKDCMSLTVEDVGVIGWDCKAGKTNGFS